MDLIFWSARSSSRREGDGVKGVDGVYSFFFGSYEPHFIRVHENLEQHPSNNISIFILLSAEINFSADVSVLYHVIVP